MRDRNVIGKAQRKLERKLSKAGCEKGTERK
jgi:hypothetical protein